MALVVASLNSGSNGNCYYIGNGKEAVLIDAGISCGEIERRMARLGLPIEAVKAVFISHEHIDHVRGLGVLTRRHEFPVYVTELTLREGGLRIPQVLRRPFRIGESVGVGNLDVFAFSKTHDAADPCSFVISGDEVRVGVFTDIGVVCDNVVRHFMRCHAAFLETNYDEVLLEKGRYPYPLKKRIRGGQGHLSNRQALELFRACRPGYMSHLLPAHLSEDNNRPELVRELFEPEAAGARIIVASRYEETPICTVDGSYIGKPGPHWNEEGTVTYRPWEGGSRIVGSARGKATVKQISLFD